jgi:imidazolonepropionase-like amidohydrolase
MIVVGQDPLEDIGTLRNPVGVINDGRVVVNRLVQSPK